MAAPVISALPDVPLRQEPATFSTKADAFLGAFPTLRSEVNAFGEYLDEAGQQIDADLSASTSARAGAESALAAAQAARDAAFVNAQVFADVAAGIAGTASGGQFQVVSGATVLRYRREANATATLVASYPTAEFAAAASAGIGTLAAALGQAQREVEALSAAADGNVITALALFQVAALIGQISDQVNGGRVSLDGGTLADPALRIGTVGIYSAAANTLSVAVSGVERLRVTASGITVYGAVTTVP